MAALITSTKRRHQNAVLMAAYFCLAMTTSLLELTGDDFYMPNYL